MGKSTWVKLAEQLEQHETEMSTEERIQQKRAEVEGGAVSLK